MKKLARILFSIALAVGLMVPAVALADDGYGNVAIEYNGQRINLKPQIDESVHSLMIKFQVQTDDELYQSYVSAGFSLSSDARSGRIAQSSTSGSTVTAVVSNGESPLKFNGDTFFLGTLTVNVNAALAPGAGTGAKLIVTQMDATDETFGSPIMYAMDTRDDSGQLISVESRTAAFTLANGAYTGSAIPDGSGGSPAQIGNPGSVKPSVEVEVGDGQMADGTSVDTGALQSLGSTILSKIKEQVDEILAGGGFYPGLTDEQLQLIAAVIEAADGDLSAIDVQVTPVIGELNAEDVAEDISLLNKKIPSATVLSVYDLGVTLEMSYDDVTTGPMSITELTEPIKFTVQVPEGSLSSMNAAVGYVHNGEAGTVSQGVKPLLQSSSVEFPAQYFSIYAVYGKEKSAMPSSGPAGSLIPLDGSLPVLMIGFGVLAVIACVAAGLTIRRRMNQVA